MKLTMYIQYICAIKSINEVEYEIQQERAWVDNRKGEQREEAKRVR